MKPIRVQRQRTKGWRMPPNTVYVGRPTLFGNPFSPALTRKQQVHLYRLFARRRWHDLDKEGCSFAGVVQLQCLHNMIMDRIGELRGKNLACWCPAGEPCHADVLLKWANKPTPSGKE